MRGQSLARVPWSLHWVLVAALPANAKPTRPGGGAMPGLQDQLALALAVCKKGSSAIAALPWGPSA